MAVIVVGVLALGQRAPSAGPSPVALGCAVAMLAAIVAAGALLLWYNLRSDTENAATPAATSAPAAQVTATPASTETAASPLAPVGSSGRFQQ